MTNYHDKKFFHVFTAGQYPQGAVTTGDLRQIAAEYDPSVYEAPIWIGHPGSDAAEEPKAYGWVESLMVSGDKLYASFSHLDEDLIEMVNSKKYRRCSVELGKLNYEPLRNKLYLIAIALTNRPAVAGLPPLEFAGIGSERNYNPAMVAGKSLYTLTDAEPVQPGKEAFGNTLNKHNKMEKILKAVHTIGIELGENATEDTLAEEILMKFTQLEGEVERYKTKAADILLKGAISSAKIVPAQESEIRQFAMDNIDACMNFIEKLPGRSLFSRSIDAKGFTGHDNQKFTKSDGTALTYSDVLANPSKYSKILTEEELIKLREESDLVNS